MDIGNILRKVRTARPPLPEGQVHEVVGLLVEVAGIVAPVGAELEVLSADRSITLEVLGFRNGRLLTAPLGSTAGISPGARVIPRRSPAHAAVGPALLGRVIDAFGEPLDGLPRPACRRRANLHEKPPSPFSRSPIRESLETGVRVLDTLLPLGRGQRVGLFAGTGVGKSTLLGMLCRHAQADVIVVGLIGERGREVGDFVRGVLGPDGLRRAVVVAATGDTPPYVRVRGALMATAIAEHFRSEGKSVLLVMDSVTRFAMALREASLASGEPPLTKGYTPSVFAAIPSLLERAGTDASGGSITAVYTVLVEGDDLQDPIADAVRGVLDGHIVLSRQMADRGVFPAVDLLGSVSRLMPEIATKEHQRDAARVRELAATYADAADLIQIGAYAKGSDPKVDAAIQARPAIEALIRQGLDERVDRVRGLTDLIAIARRAK